MSPVAPILPASPSCGLRAASVPGRRTADPLARHESQCSSRPAPSPDHQARTTPAGRLPRPPAIVYTRLHRRPLFRRHRVSARSRNPLKRSPRVPRVQRRALRPVPPGGDRRTPGQSGADRRAGGRRRVCEAGLVELPRRRCSRAGEFRRSRQVEADGALSATSKDSARWIADLG
ncbi:hypothetical protein DFJ74DRAFT_125105 [Hyaloraphidium curvatum]|nr:hypothetical protein DFJ74DRAFT_125105 [Hyaloraphidium curvatum]